ncbi:hypothetical protein M5K25_015152 [Dendrobium thyrsiflorum]|uniref:Uncharacterized protein n=1 Tax=Dendrobium thyrsiflorum TaxID=117978 RepID=A0ABD0UXH0_DENTH
MALASPGPPLFPLIPSPSLSVKLGLSSSQSAGGRNPSPFPDHSLSAKTTPTPAAAEVKRGEYADERGLLSLSPPHQGIDGEWTDKSGVIVYRWNEKEKRPNSGISNWKRRWSCRSEYEKTSATVSPWVPCNL